MCIRDSGRGLRHGFGRALRRFGDRRSGNRAVPFLFHRQRHGFARGVFHSLSLIPIFVSAKPEYRNIMERVNNTYDLGLEIPEKLRLFQLSEQHRRLVVVNISGLQRKNGSLLPSYTEEELDEATFTFVKYYVQGEHYDELVEENKKLRYELEQEISWRTRTDAEC